MKKSLILVAALLLFVLKTQGFNFKHITSEDGLSSNLINAIVQDSDDFMWFGTNYGLNLAWFK